jgi:hypothetical protein
MKTIFHKLHNNRKDIQDVAFALAAGFSIATVLTSCSVNRSTVFERAGTTYSIDAKTIHCWNEKRGYYPVKLESDAGMMILHSIASK